MSKKEKLLRRILTGEKQNIHFDDFFIAMLHAGFTHERTSGSHRIMRHPKTTEPFPIQPDKSGMAKAYQIQQFRDLHAKL